MGVTKSDIFTNAQNTIAGFAKLLAHPARVAILEYLIRQQQCVCSDLVEEIGLAQATISQHLKELKTSGIIQGTIFGTSVCYCINKDKWNEIQLLLNQFFNKNIKQINNCC